MIIIILKTIAIGIGATLAIDIWVSLLKLFKIKSLDYRYVGRWIGNFPKGKFFHNKIQDTPPIPHELIIGWTVHYLIGITFAFILNCCLRSKLVGKTKFSSCNHNRINYSSRTIFYNAACIWIWNCIIKTTSPELTKT